MHVLVVEDHPVTTRLIRQLFARTAHQVRFADEAASALACLADWTPDIILMDIQLPHIDGLTLTQLMRAQAHTATVPIIAVTAYAMPGDEQRFLAAGCQAYITKPIDVHSFVATVESLYQTHRFLHSSPDRDTSASEKSTMPPTHT